VKLVNSVGESNILYGSIIIDDGCVTPTAITLASFEAVAGNQQVTLVWQTGDETDNLGFNLYRAEAENGAYEKINETLIASKAGSGLGAAYELTDVDVQNRTTYWYKLEDIDIYGTSAFHGPVSATPRLIYGIGQ
jgi:hypothetical protein